MSAAQDGNVQAPAQGTPPAQSQTDLQAELDRVKQQYAASSSEARRLKAENDAYQGQMAQLRNFGQPQQNDPYQRLNDMGVPVDALDAVIEQRIAQRFQPLARGIQARSQVLSEYPDYQKYEADVWKWVNESPERRQRYDNMFGPEPAGAMEWAFQGFGASQQKSAPAPAKPSKAERSEAQIPSSRVDQSRNQGDQGDSTQRAWQHYRETKDPTPFIKQRLRNVISDDFFERNK